MAHEMGDESTIGAGDRDAGRDASTASASPPELVQRISPPLQGGGEGVGRAHDQMSAPNGPPGSTIAWSPAHGAAPGERPGDFIGPYKLLSMLGEGGFGVVWLAERRKPHVQRVALKIIKPGMDSRAVIARFEQERQALAVMDHPNVAKVYDAGATPLGRPYFVMEAVQGEAITTYCDRHTLTIKQRLELFIPVCEAVQHAHHKGIIHRDIKPSNILVTIKDGNAIPKVIDFGVAKAISHTLTEKTIFTEQGQIIGTPEYMSPEQAEMGALDVDTRTDVYSLGVVLYEVLAGVLPFDSEMLRNKAYGEIQRIIREVDPPRPSTKLTTSGERAVGIAKGRQLQIDALTRQLRGELEWIPLKAMRKDRTERYATPKDLADDIRHYTEGQPLDAGPETARYRLKKYLRRNRGLVTAVATIGFAFTAGIFGTTIYAIRAHRNAEITRAINDFLNEDILLAVDAGDFGPDVRVVDALDRASSSVKGRFRDQPLIAAQLYKTLGSAYLSLGILSKAMDSLQASKALFSKGLDDRADNIARIDLSIGEIKWRDKECDGALALIRSAHEHFRRTRGERDIETINAKHQMANAMKSCGELDAAELIYNQVIQERNTRSGGMHEETLVARHNLGLIFLERGRQQIRAGSNDLARNQFQKAHDAFDSVHQSFIKSSNSNNGPALGTAAELARVSQLLGMMERSLELYETTIENMRIVLGERHWRTLETIANQGAVFRKTGRLDAAAKCYAEAFEGYRWNRQLDHPNAILLATRLVDMLLELKQPEMGVELLGKAINEFRSNESNSVRKKEFVDQRARLTASGLSSDAGSSRNTENH